MSSTQPPSIIEARVVHKKSNALKMTFSDGPGEPFAVAEQGVGDSRGKKIGTLFGFNNGGSGNHQVTYRDGGVLNVASRDGKPTVLTDGGGAEIATVHRGETSSAVLSGGSEALRFVPHPTEAKTPDLFRIDVLGPGGEPVASIDVIRRESGWSLGRMAEAAWLEYVWWDRAGRPLPVPILGTRLVLDRPVSDVERTILAGVCTDIAIGLRPYIAEMG
jgi:hypothetical protein